MFVVRTGVSGEIRQARSRGVQVRKHTIAKSQRQWNEIAGYMASEQLAFGLSSLPERVGAITGISTMRRPLQPIKQDSRTLAHTDSLSLAETIASWSRRKNAQPARGPVTQTLQPV